eukprot:CAMPEP_0113689042 /NCGR_PEP_ID=MMETSP0038_2-20120614/16912_1 /TAXON_ID=2898 /ORGANISM="Cryptomonas paramecium" /LENGTH=77 /DNA_ID=CAMNT_0000610005 /DNA_START=263 /DNA_END=492 /DNA_ORIENTATION=+ /assembly_acc=CAM_ASM_000170
MLIEQAQVPNATTQMYARSNGSNKHHADRSIGNINDCINVCSTQHVGNRRLLGARTRGRTRLRLKSRSGWIRLARAR